MLGNTQILKNVVSLKQDLKNDFLTLAILKPQ